MPSDSLRMRPCRTHRAPAMGRGLLHLAVAVMALGALGTAAGRKSAQQQVLDGIETALADVQQLTDQIRGIRTMYSHSAIHKSATSACFESLDEASDMLTAAEDLIKGGSPDAATIRMDLSMARTLVDTCQDDLAVADERNPPRGNKDPSADAAQASAPMLRGAAAAMSAQFMGEFRTAVSLAGVDYRASRMTDLMDAFNSMHAAKHKRKLTEGGWEEGEGEGEGEGEHTRRILKGHHPKGRGHHKSRQTIGAANVVQTGSTKSPPPSPKKSPPPSSPKSPPPSPPKGPPPPPPAPPSVPPVTFQVDPQGSKGFKSIQAAIDKLPTDGKRYTILVKKGTYTEAVVVTVPNLYLIGEDANTTIITSNISVVYNNVTTSKTATFAVKSKAANFTAMNITFENSSNRNGHQAVALSIASDRAAVYNCIVRSFQDSLYAVTGRHYYRNCHIVGTVDFIFGNAAAVFDLCTMELRENIFAPIDTVTASGRKADNDPTGFVLQRCSIKAYQQERLRVVGYLGRDWGSRARVVVANTEITPAISLKGWIPWNSIALNNSSPWYGEFNNNGPRSILDYRASWVSPLALTKNTYIPFRTNNFIQGDSWIPQRGGIPY